MPCVKLQLEETIRHVYRCKWILLPHSLHNSRQPSSLPRHTAQAARM